jgi:hypothetical protein
VALRTWLTSFDVVASRRTGSTKSRTDSARYYNVESYHVARLRRSAIPLNGIMAPSSLMFIATRYILWVLVCDTCLTYVLSSLSCTSYLISFEVVTVSHPTEQVRRKGRTDSARCHNVERYQTRSAARLRRSAIPLNGIMAPSSLMFFATRYIRWVLVCDSA